MNLTRTSYAAGEAKLLEVLDAERLYEQARLGYARAKAQRFSDTAQLFVAMGGGWQSWRAKERPRLHRGERLDRYQAGRCEAGGREAGGREADAETPVETKPTGMRLADKKLLAPRTADREFGLPPSGLAGLGGNATFIMLGEYLGPSFHSPRSRPCRWADPDALDASC